MVCLTTLQKLIHSEAECQVLLSEEIFFFFFAFLKLKLVKGKRISVRTEDNLR